MPNIYMYGYIRYMCTFHWIHYALICMVACVWTHMYGYMTYAYITLSYIWKHMYGYVTYMYGCITYMHGYFINMYGVVTLSCVWIHYSIIYAYI